MRSAPRLLPLLLLGIASGQGHAAHYPAGHGRASAPVAPSPIVVPLDAPARAALTRHRVETTAHGDTLHCEGVSLAALLQASGAMPDAPLGGAHLDRYVRVSARDGYRAVFSLGELDPSLSGRQVYLVDRCGDVPLSDADGPLRLLVPGDARAARGVRQVERITVIASP